MGFSSYRGGRSGFCSTPSSAATMAVLLQVIIALFASASPVPATPLLRTTRQGSDGTTCSITGVGESTYILMRAGPCWSNTLDSSPQLVNGDTVIDYDGELSCMDSDVSVDCLGPEGVDPPYLAPGDCWRGVEYQGTVTGYIPVSFLDCSTTSRYRVHRRRESERPRGMERAPAGSRGGCVADCWRGVQYQGTVTGYFPVSFLDCSTTSRYIPLCCVKRAYARVYPLSPSSYPSWR